jgi:uncharacterized protein
MLNKLPEWIDPINAVNHDKRFTGRVNQSRLKRLAEAVESTDSDIDVQLDFYYDKQLRFPAFVMKLETSLRLLCQRSLTTFDYPVSTEVKGVLTETLALTDELPTDVEVFQLDGEKVSPYDWVEEELLLCVPMVPINDDSTAPEFDGGSLEEIEAFESNSASDKPNPFAVLKGLKK